MKFFLLVLLPFVVAQVCPPGEYYDFTACVQCSAGSYQPLNGLAFACSPCPVVALCPNPGMANPLAPPTCAAGTFLLQNGTCESCPAGYYYQAGSLSCVPALSGFIPTPDQSGLVACDIGTYASGRGNSVCTRCPAGSVNPNTGASNCRLCRPGRFMPTEGNADCLWCPENTAAAGNGSTSCTPCPANLVSTSGAYLCWALGSNNTYVFHAESSARKDDRGNGEKKSDHWASRLRSALWLSRFRWGVVWCHLGPGGLPTVPHWASHHFAPSAPCAAHP